MYNKLLLSEEYSCSIFFITYYSKCYWNANMEYKGLEYMKYKTLSKNVRKISALPTIGLVRVTLPHI